MLSDSPWARRVKIRSTIKEPTYNPDMGNPGNNLGGFGPGGLGHGVVPPSATEIINQAAGPQTIPCLGWGIGSMTMVSPTSEECKAAWQSVSAAKSAGLQKNSVIVLWESATPVREAKAKLDIANPSSGRATDTVIISVIAHPMLRQINPNSGPMRQLIKISAVLLLNGKHGIQPSDVAFIETDGSIVRFLFSRDQILQSGAKKLIFRFEILDTSVEAKFTLKDMVYAGIIAL